MKVLVTGAAGFIASNLVYLLVKERPEWEITALDSLTYAGNLATLDELLKENKITFSKTDITDADAVQKVFEEKKFDMVFHLAAESHVDRSLHGAADFVKTNVLGTLNLLNSARTTEVKRFAHISTDEVYGSLGAEGFFYEDTPLDPTNPYAASKASSDLMVLSYAKTHKMDCVITRCTNNYGPYQFPEKLIPLFITNAMENKKVPLYGEGANIRSWIYVEDHNRALLAVAEKGRAGEVYNIGCLPESEKTNKEVTYAILEAVGKDESLIERVADRPAHDLRYACDYTKLKEELGWEPQVNFEEGLKRTVEWYKSNSEWVETVKSGEYLNFYEKNYADRKEA